MKLENKIALVTGANKGIGLQICKALLNKNVKVYGLSRSESDLSDPNYTHFLCNVRNEQELNNVLQKIGCVDILINNAGLGYFKNLEDLSSEEWHAMFDTNVHAIFYTCKFMLPLMKKVNTGHIINISSIAGLAGIPEATAYAGTKFAVRGISQSLQREMKNTEIKVSTIFPGSVHTDFFDNYNGVQSNPTMLAAQDIAQSVIQILEMPDNALISELEIRPLNVKYS